MFLRLALASGLPERQPSFNRRDVIMHICDLLPAGADPGEVLAPADAFLESREVVHLVTGDTLLELAGGPGRQGRADDASAGRGPCLVGRSETEGLAGAGHALDDVDPGARQAPAADHDGLLGGECRPGGDGALDRAGVRQAGAGGAA